MWDTIVPPGSFLLEYLEDVSKAMDQAYGNYCSLFRTGTRKTFFSYQLENYADLYGSSCFHLLDYHPSHDFRAKFKLMPHESPMEQSKADNQQCQAADQHGQAADGYLSPNTEELIFKLCIDYPLRIRSLFVYSNKFAIRGLWYDKKRANVLKNVQDAMKYVHSGDGPMKAQTLLKPDQYVEKETRIGTLLDRIRRSGKKCFLLTNSAYPYTKGIMEFLLDTVVIVDAEKPLWFTGDADFKKVNTQTGETETVPDNIYSGGSFCKV
ncbi:hypothetical protein niasHT_015136 [Heterodera trifolii]|uniref:Uncharacterized protein n=1 Tax=Heterodera trifolii TaxID=157864 RepID=A0ABD2L9N6_9BILA